MKQSRMMNLISEQEHPFVEQLLKLKQSISPRMGSIVQGASHHDRLRESMLHGIRGSGKFIRPFLVVIFAEIMGKECDASVIDTAVAVELIHSYSLIHDDLPAMDNADLRRGIPSCWRAYDEATAILAGDALIPLAYETLCRLDVSASVRLDLIHQLSLSIGAKGLVVGQMMDLYPSAKLDDIRQMQILKTGELLSFSCLAGVILAGNQDTKLLDKAQEFGQKLGLIYQITDDLLSEQGQVSQTGKPVNNDQDKVTFISVLGVDAARGLLDKLFQETQKLALEIAPNGKLSSLLDFLKARTF